MYIEETRYSDEDKAPVFKLSDLAQLYVSQNGASLIGKGSSSL